MFGQPERGPAGLLRDALLWLIAPALFLSLYTGHFHVATSAILPHLRYVAVLLVALLLLRAALSYAFGRWYRALAAPLLAAVLLLLILYYLIVLIGLNSWSRVVSWDLIASYLPQIGELAQTLEIPLPLLALGVGVPFLALCAGMWWYLGRYDWIAPALRRLSGRMQALYLLAGLALVTLEVVNFTHDYQGTAFEPFSLTVYPDAGGANLANLSLNGLQGQALDAEQARARQTYQASPGAERRNVVLIVVDALRQSNMGVFGYARDTTPFLSRSVAEGRAVVQHGMRASCAESSCGILSISSSKYVHAFSSHPMLLQEVMKRNGYAVHMILGGDHTNFYGLRKLYGDIDSYYDGYTAKGYFPNDDTLVSARVDALPVWDKRPTMFHMHLMSVHGLGKRLGPGPFQPARSYLKHPTLYTSEAGKVEEESRNYYDNGVRQADGMIGTILASLQRKGYLDNALVVVTADHGESLGEHGLYVHANSVHEPLLRIPFVMFSYGKAPPALADGDVNASQVDIAPTILAELGIARPATWSGMALQERQRAALTYFEQKEEAGLVDQHAPGEVWKYWRNARTGAEFAFELGSDPGELHNRFEAAGAARRAEWRRRMLTPADRRPQP